MYIFIFDWYYAPTSPLKIEAMGGETVQPLATIVIDPIQAFPSQLQGNGIIKDCR